jgi:two-component system, chemotaxis family, chemotaxis protein CheY
MSINVLVVDDSMTIRAMIKKALSLSIPELGEVHEAENGIMALAQLTQNNVDLVLTDINMPRMDGVQLITKMKQIPKLADIPVVVISTDGSTERIGDLETLGIRGYLHKPFRPEQLKEVLLHILEISHDDQVVQSGNSDF